MSLWIQVIEVKNVPQPDKYHIVDPYLSLQLSSALQIQKTRVIDNATDPVWNQEFTFPLVNLSTDVLKCALIDRNIFGEDSDLAKVEVHVSDVPQMDTLDKFYDMQSLYPSDRTTQIHLKLKLITGPQPSVNPMMAQMIAQQPMNPNMMMLQNPMMNPQMMGVNPQMMGNSMNQMNQMNPQMMSVNPQMMGNSMNQMNPQMMGNSMMNQMWSPYRYQGQ